MLRSHVLLLSLQNDNNKEINVSKCNVLIMNTIKNIVVDLVKLKKEKVLEEYNKSAEEYQFNDEYLLKWIKNELEKF